MEVVSQFGSGSMGCLNVAALLVSAICDAKHWLSEGRGNFAHQMSIYPPHTPQTCLWTCVDFGFGYMESPQPQESDLLVENLDIFYGLQIWLQQLIPPPPKKILLMVTILFWKEPQ